MLLVSSIFKSLQLKLFSVHLKHLKHSVFTVDAVGKGEFVLLANE